VTQPAFVPINSSDQVRPAFLRPDASHLVGRPSELHGPRTVQGEHMGFQGPDQGYALSLAHRISKRLVLTPGEDPHDVELGTAMIAARRAAGLGRAPTIYDLEVALGIFGFLAQAPEELVEYRRAAFQAIGHSYVAQRNLVDQIPASTLALSPVELATPRSDWRVLVGAE
jgi:hypothetical protein